MRDLLAYLALTVIVAGCGGSDGVGEPDVFIIVTGDGGEFPPDARVGPDAAPTPPDAARPPDAYVPPGCTSCSEAVMTGAMPDCPGSAELLNALGTCICLGACMTQCSTACMGGMVSAECQTCIVDTSTGCGDEANACLADMG